VEIKNLINMATRPGWVYSVLLGKRWTFGNLAGHVKGTEGVKSLAQWVDSQFDETLNWKDVGGSGLSGQEVDYQKASSMSRMRKLRGSGGCQRHRRDPITAAASLTAQVPPFRCFRKSRTQWAQTSK